MHTQEGSKKLYVASMFPPDREDVVSQLPLCARILPIQGDGGGFFLAFFEKVAAEKAEVAAPDAGDGSEPRGAAHATRQLDAAVDGPQDSTQDLVDGTPGPADDKTKDIGEGARKHHKKNVADASDFRPLLRPAPPEIIGSLISEFDLDTVSDRDLGNAAEAASRTVFPLSRLFLRGSSIILASEAMAKIWSTAKSLQVVEAGQYVFSAVHRPFLEWRVYPEAVPILGRCARRRRLDLSLEALRMILISAEGGHGVECGHLQTMDVAQHGELPEGPLILGLMLPHSVTDEMSNAVGASNSTETVIGYIAGRIDAEGMVMIVEGSLVSARRWRAFLERLA